MSEQRLDQRIVDGVTGLTGEYVTGHSTYGVTGGQYVTGNTTYTTGNTYTTGTVYQGGVVGGAYQSGVVSTQVPQVVNTQVTTGK